MHMHIPLYPRHTTHFSVPYRTIYIPLYIAPGVTRCSHPLPLLCFPSLETGRQRKRKRALKRARPRRLRAKTRDRRLPVKTRDRQRLVKTRDPRLLAKTRDPRLLAKTRDPRRDHDHADALLPHLVTREAGDDALQRPRRPLITWKLNASRTKWQFRCCRKGMHEEPSKRAIGYGPLWTCLYTRPCMQRTSCAVITH